MQGNTTTLPSMNSAQLGRLLDVLEPFRAEPITPAIVALAAALIRKEAK
ncbi:hypothetical protein VRRI112168_10810 [Vreelandella rituensis]|nr:hypothetical protein [Halomonas rituensis]